MVQIQSTEQLDPAHLIRELGDARAEVRQNARAILVNLGGVAVVPLIEALSDPRPHVRWEAAKTLTELPDPSAIPKLIHTLVDRDSGIRWVAAEALIAIGTPAIRPLLQALIKGAGSPEFREGVHHVLHDLLTHENEHLLEPVLDAIDGPAPLSSSPVAASIALRKM